MRRGEARAPGRTAAALAGCLGLALALPLSASAADNVGAHGMPGIRVFRGEEGVPHSTVNAVAFEPGGRLWIGTQKGIAYHDGKGFVKVPLPDEEVSTNASALFASGGALWVGTRGAGVYRYESERFTRFTVASGLPSDDVTAILVTTRVWVGTRHGLARMSGERFEPVDLGPGLAGTTIYALAEGELPSGAPGVWVATSGGLARCEGDRCALFADEAAGLPGNEVHALLEVADEGGGRSLWVGTTGGLAHLTAGGWEVLRKETSKLPHDQVNALAQTVSASGRRTLWIGTYGGGLARVEGSVWTTIDPTHSSFPSTYVEAMAPSAGPQGDRTLWVGTDGGGVARVRRSGFTSFTPRNAPFPGSAYVEAVGETIAPDGTSTIWLGPDNGLLRGVDGAFGAVDLAGADLAGDYVTCFDTSARDPSALWIGTGSGAIAQWAGGGLTRFAPELPPAFHSIVHSLRESSGGGALWAMTNTGAARLVGGAWQSFPEGTAGATGKSTYTFAALETTRRDGAPLVWIAGGAGLARIEDGKTHLYGPSELGTAGVISLAEIREPDGARVVWAGTMAGGVARYDLDAEAWRERLTEHTTPALPDSSVNQNPRRRPGPHLPLHHPRDRPAHPAGEDGRRSLELRGLHVHHRRRPALRRVHRQRRARRPPGAHLGRHRGRRRGPGPRRGDGR